MRQCELQGIEASAEIQLAARRVADENKKLRALIAMHGIGDDLVESYLRGDQDPDASARAATVPAVQSLETLLTTKRPSCRTACPPALDSASRDSSIASARTVHSLPFWSNAQQGDQDHFLTPRSTVSRGGSIPSGRRGSIASSAQPDFFNYNSPSLLPNPPDPQYQHPTHMLPAYAHAGQMQHASPFSHQDQSRSSHYLSTTGPNTNSCVYAADLITAMAGGGDPQEVQADLGCAPGVDCEVDNHLVFNMMDRYSDQNMGI